MRGFLLPTTFHSIKTSYSAFKKTTEFQPNRADFTIIFSGIGEILFTVSDMCFSFLCIMFYNYRQINSSNLRTITVKILRITCKVYRCIIDKSESYDISVI